MSTGVGAKRERVWRAITEPGERATWDEQIIARIDRDAEYPRVGQNVRWSYRLGTVSIVLHDRPVEVVSGERIRSEIALGLFHFEETWSLADEGGDDGRTRLSLKIAARNAVPVVGGLLDRFAVRRMASEYVDRQLRSVRGWCEAQP